MSRWRSFVVPCRKVVMVKEVIAMKISSAAKHSALIGAVRHNDMRELRLLEAVLCPKYPGLLDRFITLTLNRDIVTGRTEPSISLRYTRIPGTHCRFVNNAVSL